MRIVADAHIPFLRGVFEPHAEVVYLEPEDLTPASVREADALLVRTRTRCNEHLLAGSRVRTIFTGTIGFDHIDTSYCESHSIFWSNCPGCNAQGVCDWVESAITAADIATQGKTIGVVGVGHVGSLVAEMAEKKGMRVICYDPFVPQDTHTFVSFEELAHEADIITFHTPLTKQGSHPSFHMADAAWLSQTKADAYILNAARGGVIDEQALLASGRRFALDCWENEPQINPLVAKKCEIGTFHIAGYTKMGKYNATKAIIEGMATRYDLPVKIDETQRPAPAPHLFNIRELSNQLKSHPEDFEAFREAYQLR